MNNFLARLREPSTWAGLAALSTIFGVPQNKIEAVSAAVTALFGMAAVFMPERKE
jgi:hypothetical protein